MKYRAAMEQGDVHEFFEALSLEVVKKKVAEWAQRQYELQKRHYGAPGYITVDIQLGEPDEQGNYEFYDFVYILVGKDIMMKEFENHLPEIKKLAVTYDESSAHSIGISVRFWPDGRTTAELAQFNNSDGLTARERVEMRLRRYCMYDFCDPEEQDEADIFDAAVNSIDLETRLREDFQEFLDDH